MRISDWSSDVCSSDLFPSHDKGNVKNFRIVGAAIQARSLAANLNKQGALYCASTRQPYYPGMGVGGSSSLGTDNLVWATIPAIEDQTAGSYVKADVNNGEGVMMTWQPLCLEQIDFMPNPSQPGFSSTTSENFNVAVIIGTRLGASCPLELRIVVHYEVQPVGGSILTGMEEVSLESVPPTKIWREFYKTIKPCTVLSGAGMSGSLIYRS